jgi:hypothetical protein
MSTTRDFSFRVKDGLGVFDGKEKLNGGLTLLPFMLPAELILFIV